MNKNEEIIELSCDDLIEVAFPSGQRQKKMKASLLKFEGNFDLYDNNDQILFSSETGSGEIIATGVSHEIFLTLKQERLIDLTGVDRIVGKIRVSEPWGLKMVREKSVTLFFLKLLPQHSPFGITFSAKYAIFGDRHFLKNDGLFDEVNLYFSNLLSFLSESHHFRPFFEKPRSESFSWATSSEEISYCVNAWDNAVFSFVIENTYREGMLNPDRWIKQISAEAKVSLKFQNPLSLIEICNKIGCIDMLFSILFGQKIFFQGIEVKGQLLLSQTLSGKSTGKQAIFELYICSEGKDYFDSKEIACSFGDIEEYFEYYLNGHIYHYENDEVFKSFVTDRYLPLLTKNNNLDDVGAKIRTVTNGLKILHEKFCEEHRLKLRDYNCKTKNLVLYSPDMDKPSVIKDLFVCFPLDWQKTFGLSDTEYIPIDSFLFLFIDLNSDEERDTFFREIVAFVDQDRHPDEPMDGYLEVSDLNDRRFFALLVMMKLYLLRWIVFSNDMGLFCLNLRLTGETANCLKKREQIILGI